MNERRASDRTGVLAIRLWRARRRLHARIRSTLDVMSEEPTVVMCESEKAILEEVHRWLRDFAAGEENNE